jgi:hypothetical protein
MLSSLALATLLAASGPEPAGGRLCYARPDQTVDALATCMNTPGRTTAAVSTAPASRIFLWISTDGREATIGELQAGESKVDLAAGRQIPVPRIIETDEEAWQPVIVEFLTGSTTARVQLPAGSTAELRTLRAPAGLKEVRFSARHYFPEPTLLSSKLPAQISLRRLPSVSGRVVEGDTSTPLERATISTPERLSTKTDAGGRFQMEFDGEWPTHIEVSAVGKGSVIVELPPARPGVQLPIITMRNAGTLVASLIHNGALRAEIAQVGSKGEHVVSEQKLTADESDLRVTSLSAGTYSLHLIGPRPLQHFAQTFVIHSGQETYVDIMLIPHVVEIAVRHRGEPVSGATIDVMHTNPKWKAILTTDNGGRASEDLWQIGSFGLVVSSQGFPGYFTTKSAPEKDNIQWMVDLPTTRLHGTIVDAATKSPIAKADVGMEVITKQSNIQLRTLSDADGTFAFDGIPPGDEILTVKARGFVRKEIARQYDEAEDDIKLDVALARAVQIVLAISTSSGAPASGAIVIDSADADSGGLAANAQGRCEVSLEPGETATFFIIPPSGSFAITHLFADSGTDVVNVTVPEGNATIRFEAVADRPMPTVNLLVRYNNAMIRPHVIDAFFRAQGNLFRITGGVGILERMPSGVYEIWPLFNEQRIPELAESESRARVVVRPGENVVTLKFVRK